MASPMREQLAQQRELGIDASEVKLNMTKILLQNGNFDLSNEKRHTMHQAKLVERVLAFEGSW